MPVEIVISMDDRGAVGFKANTDNVILLYGLLVVAHDTVAAQKAASENSRIIQPVGMLGPMGPAV